MSTQVWGGGGGVSVGAFERECMCVCVCVCVCVCECLRARSLLPRLTCLMNCGQPCWKMLVVPAGQQHAHIYYSPLKGGGGGMEGGGGRVRRDGGRAGKTSRCAYVLEGFPCGNMPSILRPFQKLRERYFSVNSTCLLLPLQGSPHFEQNAARSLAAACICVATPGIYVALCLRNC